MININQERLGLTLDDFLESKNELMEVTAIAHKRILAWQIEQVMKTKHVTKIEMARRMHTSRSAIDRLLNPSNSSITLETIDRAASALGMTLNISLVEKDLSV